MLGLVRCGSVGHFSPTLFQLSNAASLAFSFSLFPPRFPSFFPSPAFRFWGFGASAPVVVRCPSYRFPTPEKKSPMPRRVVLSTEHHCV